MIISRHKGHFFRNVEKNPYNILEDEKGKYNEKSKWLSTMSMKIDIKDKLNCALEKLKQLDNKQQIQIAGTP